MLLYQASTISLLVLQITAECFLKPNTLTCNGGDFKSISFYYNTRNGTVTSIELTNTSSETVNEFLQSIDDEEINKIEVIRMQNCGFTNPPEVINSLQTLITLDLKYNDIENADFILTLPKSIKEIYLGYNKISTIPDVFSEFKDLVIIDLSGCSITAINFMVFKSNENLALVNLSRNQIEVSESDEYLKNIKCVDLSYNNFKKYTNVPSLCLDFSYTDMSGYSWFNIAEGNKSVVVDRFFFSGNRRLKLKASNINNDTLPIVINYMNVSGYQGDVADLYLDGVKVRYYLSIADSKKIDLGRYDFKVLFYNGSNATFDASNSSIDDIPDEYFSGLNLGVLNLCYNNLTTIKDDVFKNSYIIELDLCQCGIKAINDNAFTNLHVSVLNLSGNQLDTLNFITSIDTARFINLSSNDIKSINNEMIAIKNLESVDLSGNQISVIDKNIFTNNNYLKTLFLNNNNISGIAKLTFVNMTRLKELYLDGNPIEIIETNAFNNLPELEVLNIGNVDIYVIKTNAFNNVNNIKRVYLKNNRVDELQLMCKMF